MEFFEWKLKFFKKEIMILLLLNLYENNQIWKSNLKIKRKKG
jgi:hypothetical protein